MIALTLALLAFHLLGQPLQQEPKQEGEKVAIVARKPQEQEGFLHRFSKDLRGAVRRLYEKEEPNALEGNALAAEGKAQAALDSYEKAKVPEESPAEGALAFDRSGALLKLGAEQAPKAVQEASRAMDKGAPQLKSQAAYQLGLGFEQLGKPEEAMTAYAQALQLDPDDEDAKVNLELLLRSQKEQKKDEKNQQGEKKKEKKESQKSSESKDDQSQQGGKDQNEQKKPEEKGEDKKQQQSQGNPKEGEKKDEQKGEQAKQEEKPGEPKKEEEQAQGQPQQLDRSEAQRLLDALRAGEKNLQVWRFAQKKTKEGRRPDAAKDW